MKVIVTGVSGYLGSYLTQHLNAAGIDVHAIVRPTTDLSRLSQLLKDDQIHIHRGSSQHMHELCALIQPDMVYHCAGRVLTDHTVDDLDDLIESNILFPTQLLDALADIPNCNFVNVGTYLEFDTLGNEKPVSIYGASKTALKRLAEYYSTKAANLNFVTVNFPIIYGAEDNRRRLLTILRSAASTGESVSLSGGHQKIDLIHVNDAVTALINAGSLVSKENNKFTEYFATTGQLISIRELVALIESIINKSLPIKWGAVPYKDSEIMCPFSGVDRKLPNWEPQTPLQGGLKAFFNKDLESHNS